MADRIWRLLHLCGATTYTSGLNGEEGTWRRCHSFAKPFHPMCDGHIELFRVGWPDE